MHDSSENPQLRVCRECRAQAAIANAATLDEVARLEEALRAGHMPSQLADAAATNGVNGDAGSAAATAMDEG